MPAMSPQALEDRLQVLAAFLETSIAKRQQKGYGSRSAAAVTSAVPYGGSGLAGTTGGTGGGQSTLYGGVAPGFGITGAGPFGYGAINGGAGVDDPMIVMNKRRRLEHAAQQEDEMAQRIRFVRVSS